MIEIEEQDIKGHWKNKYNEIPVVSIRCMVYNQVDYLEKTLDGFIMQITDFPFEVIIHDDASTDGSAELIRQYENKYPSIIKAIYETENQYSKGKGLISKIVRPYLSGEFIAFCEGDDYWIDKYKLQKQIDYMQSHPKCGLCYTNFDMYYQKQNRFIHDILRTQTNSFPSDYTIDKWLINPGYTAPMTWVFRKEIFDSLPSIKTVDGTFVWFAHFLVNSDVFCLKDDTTAVYRVLPESASHTRYLNKAYNRNKKLHEVSLTMVKIYKLSEITKQQIDINYYSKTYIQIALMNDSIELDKAKKYNKSIKKRIIIFLLKVPPIRCFFRWIWKMKQIIRE